MLRNRRRIHRPPPAAVHHTILVVDIVGFGDPARTNAVQLTVRAGLYRSLENAFLASGIPWSACYREDRGDGVFILAPADVPKGLFVEVLPYALAEALSQYNKGRAEAERIRLRMALHAGEVNYDDHGATATAITLAFRLVNARALRAALAAIRGQLAVIVSQWFFDEVIRNSPVIDSGHYRPVRMVAKRVRARAWILAPARRGPRARHDQHPAPGPPVGQDAGQERR